MTQWWGYTSAKVAPRKVQIPRAQPTQIEPVKQEGGFFEKALKTVSYPVRKGGEIALDKLGDYTRRFTTPTAAWALENILEFDDMIGGYKLSVWPLFGRENESLSNYFQRPRLPGIEKKPRTIFGNSIEDGTAINPLKAYNGDDDEIARAEMYMSQLDPLTRMAVETAFDPTILLTWGTGTAGRGLVAAGAKTMGMSGEEAAIMRKMLSGSGALKNTFKNRDDIFRVLREMNASPESKAMLASGVMLNILNGLPETMLDTFFRMAAKPLSKVPTLRVEMRQLGDTFRLRPKLEWGGMAKQSVRSKVDMSIAASHQLVETTKRQLMLENPTLDMLEINQEALRRIANPNTDFSHIGGLAEEAHRTIHEMGINLDDLIERGSPLMNDHTAFIERDLQTRIAEGFMRKYNVPGRVLDKAEVAAFGKAAGLSDEVLQEMGKKGGLKDIDFLPRWQQITARALQLQNGYRFFRNKVAATWVHGILMSPYYLTQNIISDPFFSGFKYMHSPESFTLEFAHAPHAVMNHLINRGGMARRLEFTGQDFDDMYRMLKEGEIFGEQVGQMGQSMAGQFLKSTNKYTGGGYIMENVDRLVDFGRKHGAYGDNMRNALHGLPLIPMQGAAMMDDKSWMGIYGSIIKKIYGEKLFLHPNPVISSRIRQSEQVVADLLAMGVPEAKARTFGWRYITSSSKEELMNGARAISELDPSALTHIDDVSDNLVFSRNITQRVQQAVKNHWKYDRQTLISGRTALEGGKQVRYEGIDEIFRMGLRDELNNNIKWSWDGFPSLVDNMIKDANLPPSMTDYLSRLRTNYDYMRELDMSVMKRLNYAKATSRDVRVWGDIAARNFNAKQQLNHMIHDAITGAQDGTFKVNWKKAAQADVLSKKAADDVAALTDDFERARKAGLKSTGLQREKAIGDFRAKWDDGNVLPANASVDELDNFIKTKLDEVWSNHFDEVRGTMGIQGNAIRMENRTFEAYQENLYRYTREVSDLMDSHAASSSAIMDYASKVDDIDPEVGRELIKLQEDSSRVALDMANERMGNFYEGLTGLDETLQWLFPFARFGIRVATVGPRVIARNPGLAPMFYRWQHAAEKIPSPVPSWMPLVGNVWFNPMGALAPYQQYSAMTQARPLGDEFMQNIQQTMGMMGVAPNPLLIAAGNAVGNEEGAGTLFPFQKPVRALAYAPEMAGLPRELGAPIRGTDWAMNRVRAAIYGGPAEDILLTREIERTLVDMGYNPATTPKESTEYQEAKKKAIATQGLDFMGGGIVRQFPKERIELAKRETQAIAKMGISTDVQAALRRKGRSAYELLTNEQKQEVIAAIGEEEFTNRSSITPYGLNTDERNKWHALQSYYATSNAQQTRTDRNIMALGQRLMDGEISGEQYRDERATEYATKAAIDEAGRRAILAEIYGADILDETKVDSNTVRELFDGLRIDLKRATGRKIKESKLEEDEALDNFHAISPDNFKDTMGDIDWAQWENARQSYLLSLPSDIQSYIERTEERRKTRDPVEAMFEQAKLEYDEQQQIQRYFGISMEQQDDAVEALKLLGAIQDRGIKRDRALVLLQRYDPRAAVLARVALKRPNPAYKRFRETHPLIQLFFSDRALPVEIANNI